MPARSRLLLVGAGHAHLEVLRRLILEQPADFDATVVSPVPYHVYSAMTPGYLAGQYTIHDISLDVAGLARQAGVACVIGRAVRLDPPARTVALEDGRVLGYDMVSLNIGSLPAGGDRPAARHAEGLKPLHQAAGLRDRLAALAAGERSRPVRVVVIGAGAGGVEVAFAAAGSLDRAGQAREVTVVDRCAGVLPGCGRRFRRLTERALAAHRIGCRLGVGAAGTEPDRVLLSDGGQMPSDLAIWLTGPQGAPILAESGLPTDPRGFLWTDDVLRSTADSRVFAVGDCGTMAGHPGLAKSGVYAVREAPILWHNLLATVRARPLRPYRPQRGFLTILNTADGRALLSYQGLVSWSGWAWRLKDRIDRGFIRRYRRLTEGLKPY